ncbi:MAG: hypothetical protein EXR82_02145 [Gammaproteobacteria bacterium]|nr:hypothetical protein [Gammaproteobacteria bacterium]
METVVVRIAAKAGMEDKVEAFYLSQRAEYEVASGFIDRKILKARTGAMFNALKSRMTPEQIARHPAPKGDAEPGTDFILIEHWVSIDARMDFTMSRNKERDKELFPYLLPQHASEFFEEIST